jgi:hypothetical protein
MELFTRHRAIITSILLYSRDTSHRLDVEETSRIKPMGTHKNRRISGIEELYFNVEK